MTKLKDFSRHEVIPAISGKAWLRHENVEQDCCELKTGFILFGYEVKGTPITAL
jgi:hypothetical protein